MSLSQKLSAISPFLNTRRLPEQNIVFQGWAPDSPDLGNQGTITAKNVLPRISGFGPFPGLSLYAPALDSRCRGAVAVRDAGGNVVLYAGDGGKLYSLSATEAVDVSKGGGYTVGDDSSWEFAQFGQVILATCFDEAVQGGTVGSGSFSDHFTSTNKPKARHIDVVGDTVVLGNTTDTTDGATPSRVWWSALNSSTDFDPSATTQSDYQDLPDSGWVQRILGGYLFGLVFQETVIRRMTYVGPPLVYQFDVIDRFRGTPIPNSVIGHGKWAFFIGEEGFLVTTGGEAVNIGNEAVNREFWSTFDRSYSDRVSTTIDPVSQVVAWGFPGRGSSGGVPNKLFLYNWVSRKWSYCDIEHEVQFRGLTQGYTLDGLDSIGELDSLPFSLDSRAWTSGAMKLSAFNSSHRLGYFEGDNLEATLETGEFNIGGKKSTVMGVRPVVDAGTPTVAIASRDTPQATASYGSAVAINSYGVSPHQSEGRYHRVKTVIPAATSWNHAQGVQIEAAAGGKY